LEETNSELNLQEAKRKPSKIEMEDIEEIEITEEATEMEAINPEIEMTVNFKEEITEIDQKDVSTVNNKDISPKIVQNVLLILNSARKPR
jgi:hypothetical protein